MKQLVLLFVLILTTATMAHFPWIHSDRFVLDKGKSIALYVGWGHGFPFGGFMDSSETQNHTIISPTGEKVAASFTSTHEFKTNEKMNTEGTYLLGAVRAPSFYSKTTKGGKRGNLKTLKDDKVLSCTYTYSYMKGLVNLGKGTQGATGTIGHDMEITLSKDPATLALGEKLPFTVLFQGKPAVVTVNATWHGHMGSEEYVESITTDKKGQGNITLSHQGVWLFEAVLEMPYAEEDVCETERHRAVLTFPFVKE